MSQDLMDVIEIQEDSIAKLERKVQYWQERCEGSLFDAVKIIEARLPLYQDIGQQNALKECISSIRGSAGLLGFGSRSSEADLKAKLEKALNHLGNALRISMRNEAADELDDAADFLAATLKELSE